jgi:hypothetical protein
LQLPLRLQFRVQARADATAVAAVAPEEVVMAGRIERVGVVVL